MIRLTDGLIEQMSRMNAVISFRREGAGQERKEHVNGIWIVISAGGNCFGPHRRIVDITDVSKSHQESIAQSLAEIASYPPDSSPDAIDDANVYARREAVQSP